MGLVGDGPSLWGEGRYIFRAWRSVLPNKPELGGSSWQKKKVETKSQRGRKSRS